MLDKISVVTRTQMIVVDPVTSNTKVIEAGPIGPLDPESTGTEGEDAPDAFDIAVENGFPGTVTQWIESLSAAEDDIFDPDLVGGVHVSDITDTEVIGAMHVSNIPEEA